MFDYDGMNGRRWRKTGARMKILFSTDAIHPRDRFEHWHRIACSTFAPHDSVPDHRETFKAMLATATIGDVSLVEFATSAKSVRRTTRHVSAASPETVFICRQQSGVITIEQDGRNCELAEGQLALLDPRAPYAIRFATHAKMLVVKAPRAMVETHLGDVRGLRALPLPASHDDTAFLAEYLLILKDFGEGLTPRTQDLAVQQTLELLAAAFASMPHGILPGASSSKALIRIRLQTIIDAHLSDHSLNPAALAAAAGVSVRYANAALAQHGTSIMRLLLSRRLARCRRALEDPAQMHRSVGDLAYSWGFSDLSHFGRAFRTAFGLSPSAYRKRMLASTEQQTGCTAADTV
ncbi:MAG: helix-turn-helix domain-containing protein [Acetobacteraceae bacterium]